MHKVWKALVVSCVAVGAMFSTIAGVMGVFSMLGLGISVISLGSSFFFSSIFLGFSFFTSVTSLGSSFFFAVFF